MVLDYLHDDLTLNYTEILYTFLEQMKQLIPETKIRVHLTLLKTYDFRLPQQCIQVQGLLTCGFFVFFDEAVGIVPVEATVVIVGVRAVLLRLVEVGEIELRAESGKAKGNSMTFLTITSRKQYRDER